MPLYEYRCEENGHVFEARHGVNEPAPVCPICGSPVRRVIQPVGIVFKGSGFYATDSRNSSSATKPSGTDAGDAKDGASKSTEAPAETKKTESTSASDTSSEK